MIKFKGNRKNARAPSPNQVWLASIPRDIAWVALLSWFMVGCSGESTPGADPMEELDPSVQVLVRNPGGKGLEGRGEAAPAAGLIFADASSTSGIEFHHVHGAEPPILITETLGPGACWIDFDNDGFLDLYMVNGNHWRVPNPNDHPINHMFRNRGNGTFEDVTTAAGVGDPGYGYSCAVGDIDNDGYDDLYVTNYGANVLYRNQGDGTFKDVSKGSGVTDPRMSATALFADFDGDSLSDLYVANFVDFENGPKFCLYNGINTGCSDREYDGLNNALYRNNGDGTFTDITEQAQISDNRGRSLALVAADLDLDGPLDIYVGNDGGVNGYYRNRGDGTFEDLTLVTGTGYSEEGTGEATMGVDASDYDNDGDVDIFVTNFSQETFAFYRNEGDNFFHYASADVGVGGPTFVPLGWGTAFFDYDNDTDLDLFVSNGHVYDVCNLINSMDHWDQPNLLFRNRGDGTFEDVTRQAGPGLALVKASRSAAFADYDNDGDIDILVGNNGGSPDLLRNEMGSQSGHWVTIRLEGTSSPRSGVGARLTATASDLVLVRQRKAGGSFLSGNDPRIHIGLGGHDRLDSLEIFWPSGHTDTARNLPANTFYLAREGEGVVKDPRVNKP